MDAKGSDIAASDGLHARARAFVRAYEIGAPAPESLDALACDLARFQAAKIPGFARLCARHGKDPAALASASDIPAVPTDAFKVARVYAFGAEKEDAPFAFQTSGTTIGRRGRHAMRRIDTYDAAALAFGRRMLVPSLETGARLPILVLGPPPSELPDSSLTHMIAHFVAELGTPASVAETYFLRDGVFELAAFDERVARLMVQEAPVLLLGTSFAFVHFLDALGDDTFRLPAGSRVMQTGGFKGKSREVSAQDLRRDLSRVFCIEEGNVVSEYGMTELSSQFYTQAGAEALAGIFREPPWAQVTPVDPETLQPVPDGKVGIARILDLCNVDSAVVVQTQDLVRREGDGFVLLGRMPGATPRGCSIAIDEMLGPS